MIQNTIRWRSDWLDGAVVVHCLGIPGQTKVSGDCQRETSHEICCLAAQYSLVYCLGTRLYCISSARLATLDTPDQLNDRNKDRQEILEAATPSKTYAA